MKALFVSAILLSCALTPACLPHARSPYSTTQQSLALHRVVLYRNGVGYFERRGEVKGDLLRLKVRKDQINDLLKSLTVVDRANGQAVSVSMPLDPQTWANAALATLAPGHGSLSRVLDALRGVEVELGTVDGPLQGRIVMVEKIDREPEPAAKKPPHRLLIQELGRDHKITLLEGLQLRVARLSKVETITLKDGDLAMQFHRRLDATAGEGMFQQVEVEIRLSGDSPHDLVISYVVSAPMWKPTYRVVLPEDGKGEALLQAWAVVDNTSGEDWRDVYLSLTAGAPIAFRYDLHTPHNVFREDLTARVHSKRTRVAMGETSYKDDADDEAPEAEEAAKEYSGAYAPTPAAAPPAPSRRARRPGRGWKSGAKRKGRAKSVADGFGTSMGLGGMGVARDALTLAALKKSTRAQARAKQVSGLSRFDIASKVTVPDGSATMVAVINQSVEGEETFLFKPGGGGSGYENNPYRVVRFRNTTPFALEPGPISIYSSGSFVGEGISETVGANSTVTIPFAVQSGIMVSRENRSIGDELKLIKIVRGTLHVERFSRRKTIWTAKAQTKKDGFTVLIRHPRAGSRYKLQNPPKDTEELSDAYLVPLVVPKGKREAKLEIVEQTPSRTTITIWDGRATKLLKTMLAHTELTAENRKKLEPIMALRQDIGKIDTQLHGLKRQQRELDDRADQTRENLLAIENDKSAAAAKLRRQQQQRLDEFTKDGNRLGRELVALQSTRLQKKIRLGDLLQTLTLTTPDSKKPRSKKTEDADYE